VDRGRGGVGLRGLNVSLFGGWRGEIVDGGMLVERGDYHKLRRGEGRCLHRTSRISVLAC